MSTGARRSVVVTGAGGGVGAEIARSAAARSWVVGVLDRDGDAAERVAASLGANGVALAADTTDEAAVGRALDAFADVTGGGAPDGLVANAGIVRFGSLATLPVDDWRAVVDVNLTGTFLSARAVAARMLDAGTGGSIVTVTSINGVAPGPHAGAYGATKAAVALLTQQMALEWGPSGIRANAVAPGLIDAGMSRPDLRGRRHPSTTSCAGPARPAGHRRGRRRRGAVPVVGRGRLHQRHGAGRRRRRHPRGDLDTPAAPSRRRSRPGRGSLTRCPRTCS